MIDIKNVEKFYGTNHVLRGINLQVEQGESVAIRGASGSGKSTLLYLLGALEKADKGQVTVAHSKLNNLNDEELAEFRNKKIGFVFQFHFLLPSLTAEGNILLPSRLGDHKLEDVKKKIYYLAERLGVQNCLQKWPHQLSGGEQQRINIIRALSLTPQLLLCDEPTGNLDSRNSVKVTDLLKELAFDSKSTLVVVTHDDRVADSFERKIVIEDGQIIR
jgi:ABC-type lipoprotein export system ATPase subunit